MRGGDIKASWAQKVTQEKSVISPKILNYTMSSCIIFCAKVSQYSHYMYFCRINTSWSESIDTFWSEGNETGWHRKSQTKY